MNPANFQPTQEMHIIIMMKMTQQKEIHGTLYTSWSSIEKQIGARELERNKCEGKSWPRTTTFTNFRRKSERMEVTNVNVCFALLCFVL